MRWARLRRVTVPLFFAPEIGSGMLLPALVVTLTAGTVAGVLDALTLATLCYWPEHQLAVRPGWHRSPRMLTAVLVRDAMIPMIWLGAGVQSAIVWQGNAMDVRSRRGVVDPVSAPTS